MSFTVQALNWIKLLSVRGISESGWLTLRKRFDMNRLVEMAECREGVRQLSRLTGNRIAGVDNRFIDSHMEAAAKNILKAVTIDEEGYPALLREIHGPPPVLFFRGRLPCHKNLNIAVVGSRSAGRRGLVHARRIASELSERSVTVVSGLARGVDTAAHTGALKGTGGTVAVTGCGLDVAYPPENSDLAIDISENGCVMTEYPLGTPPLKHHFPSRNRILSGISGGVVIVEAGLRSGAMITARWAADQGREVFAVPGPVEHPGSAGPHRLIKEGAVLVENAEDILGFLDPFSNAAGAEKPAERDELGGLDEQKRTVISLLELEPVHVDAIARETGAATERVMALLLELEMAGYCRSLGGGMFALEDRCGG